jgi:hypothetical protein
MITTPVSSSPAAGKSPYLLLFRAVSTETYKTLSAEQRQRLFTQWYAWYDSLAAQGKLLHGHPLDEGGRVVSAHGGRVMDGPFVEAKEVVGGYFFLTVDSLDEAVEIAKQCPTLTYNLGLTVEVRPVAGLCPGLSATPAGEAREKMLHAAL